MAMIASSICRRSAQEDGGRSGAGLGSRRLDFDSTHGAMVIL
jgi:hypothetical protein